MPVGFWIAVTVVCSAAAGATVMNIINKWPAAPDREGIELQSVDGLCSPTRLMRTEDRKSVV